MYNNILIYCGKDYKYENCIYLNANIEPEEQLNVFVNYLKKGNKFYFTNSPYILNYLNLLLCLDIIDYSSLSVLHFVDNLNPQELKVVNEKLVNTNAYSDLINSIYDKYEICKNNSKI